MLYFTTNVFFLCLFVCLFIFIYLHLYLLFFYLLSQSFLLAPSKCSFSSQLNLNCILLVCCQVSRCVCMAQIKG